MFLYEVGTVKLARILRSGHFLKNEFVDIIPLRKFSRNVDVSMNATRSVCLSTLRFREQYGGICPSIIRSCENLKIVKNISKYPIKNSLKIIAGCMTQKSF